MTMVSFDFFLKFSMRAKYGVSFSYASRGIANVKGFATNEFYINLAIFKNKGHNLKVMWSLTLVSLEKVLQVEYTSHI